MRSICSASCSARRTAAVSPSLESSRASSGTSTIEPSLRTVAIREAWHLYERDTREPSIELFPALDPRHDAFTQQTAARDALRALVELPPKQRDTLALLILGFSYAEIATQRRVTKTNVNRHITRARAHLRIVRDQH
ncbi:RNA polymerase sigma factor [Baekduia sp.]|uniref:RNA polymerase sigma factor n=1 Tax=Baekduia sp. TaxID=2600305 RepID=UPI0039C862CE